MKKKKNKNVTMRVIKLRAIEQYTVYSFIYEYSSYTNNEMLK